MKARDGAGLLFCPSRLRSPQTLESLRVSDTPTTIPFAMGRGNPRVSFRLDEGDLAVLKQAAASVPVSELIRQKLTGRGPLAGIPWECLKLDAELAELDRKARFEILRQPEFLSLLRTPPEQISEWGRELSAAKAVRREHGVQAFEKAQRTIRELEPVLARLRDLERKAANLIPSKAAELKRAAGLGAVADVPGGSLQRSIEKLINGLNELDALESRYRFVRDEPEIAAQLKAAEERVEAAKADVEALVSRYQTALAEREKLREEKEAVERAQREHARQSLRPCAEELFHTAKELEKALDELRREFLAHPGIQKVDLLAQRLWELRGEFSAKVSQAGELERSLVPRPSKAVKEMLKVLQTRHPEGPSDFNANAMAMLRWIVNAVVRLDEDGIPTITPLPPTIPVKGPQLPDRKRG